MKTHPLGRIILFAFVVMGLLSVMGIIVCLYEVLENNRGIYAVGAVCFSLGTYAFYTLFDKFKDKL